MALQPVRTSVSDSSPNSTEQSNEAHSEQEALLLTETPGSQYYLPYMAVKAAVDQKGLDIRAIDVSHCTNITDVFVLISGTSERHVESLSDKIRTALGKEGENAQRSSGYESSNWVILDYGNMVVHIFYEPTRQHYHFDELWKKGLPLSAPPSLEREMRMLRTGIYR